MTFVRIYLVGYFLLVFGALFALWQAGVLRQLPEAWVLLGALAAIGSGLLLAVASRTRRVTTSRD